jgi:hypothetical protein
LDEIYCCLSGKESKLRLNQEKKDCKEVTTKYWSQGMAGTFSYLLVSHLATDDRRQISGRPGRILFAKPFGQIQQHKNSTPYRVGYAGK